MAAAPVAGKRDVGSEGLVVERKAESGDGTPDFVDDGIEALGGGETRVENALSIERTDASDRDVARRKRTERTEGGGESAGVDRRNLAHKGKRQVKVGASGEAGQRIDSGESLGVAGKSVAHVVRQQKRGKNAGHGKSCH